jgi:hypothetical protein
VTIDGFGVAEIGRAPGGIAWRPISGFFRLETITVPTHCIDFNRLEVYVAGALLVTLLAYPGESRHDDEPRSRVHAALCACVLRAPYETDPDWSISPQLAKPVYMLQSKSDCERGLRQLKRRLRDRMIAARMAYPFLKEAETGVVPELPPSVERLSINAMSELVLEDAGYSEPENVETRIWRPSLPVIHLASAVHGYLHLGAENEALGVGPLLTCRDVIEDLIRSAEHCEPLVARSRHLRVNADKLIKLRLK